jgi:hypothetical protein
MMEKELGSDMSGFYFVVMRLIAREDFIAFTRGKNLEGIKYLRKFRLFLLGLYYLPSERR